MRSSSSTTRIRLLIRLPVGHVLSPDHAIGGPAVCPETGWAHAPGPDGPGLPWGMSATPGPGDSGAATLVDGWAQEGFGGWLRRALAGDGQGLPLRPGGVRRVGGPGRDHGAGPGGPVAPAPLPRLSVDPPVRPGHRGPQGRGAAGLLRVVPPEGAGGRRPGPPPLGALGRRAAPEGAQPPTSSASSSTRPRPGGRAGLTAPPPRRRPARARPAAGPPPARRRRARAPLRRRPAGGRAVRSRPSGTSIWPDAP